jgi:hypothetical protein
MKNFRRFCFAIVLAAVFSVSALADPGATQGPPAPGDTHGPPSAAGITQTPGLLVTLLALLSLP